jgi:hypothetical protein
MILRLWHAIAVGHRWRVVSAVFNRPDASASILCTPTEGETRRLWGFTELFESCACGARRRRRLIGDHSHIATNAELNELERLAGR